MKKLQWQFSDEYNAYRMSTYTENYPGDEPYEITIDFYFLNNQTWLAVEWDGYYFDVVNNVSTSLYMANR